MTKSSADLKHASRLLCGFEGTLCTWLIDEHQQTWTEVTCYQKQTWRWHSAAQLHGSERAAWTLLSVCARGEACSPLCYSLRGQSCWTTTSSGLRRAACILGIGLSALFKQLGEIENELINLRAAEGRCSQRNLSQQHRAELELHYPYLRPQALNSSSHPQGAWVEVKRSRIAVRRNIRPTALLWHVYIICLIPTFKILLSFVIFIFLFFFVNSVFGLFLKCQISARKDRKLHLECGALNG